jgi:hypothetical protein
MIEAMERQKRIEDRMTAEQHRQQTRYQKRRGMTRSNYGIWKEARAKWVVWLERFGFKRKARKITANPIPAHLRPWVPKNRTLSENDAYKLLFELRKVCTPSQYKTLVSQYHLGTLAGVLG